MSRRANLEPTIPKVELNVTKIYAVFSYHYAPDYVFEGEYHEPWELLFVISGEVIVETNEHTALLKSGEIYLHKPNEFHVHKANNVDCNVCAFSFDCSSERIGELSGHVLQTTQYIQSLLLRLCDEGTVCLSGKNYMPLLSKKRNTDFGDTQTLKNLLELILIELIRTDSCKYKGEDDFISLKNKNIINSIKHYLEENYYKKLSLEEIAIAMHYSVPHICSVFKKNVGISIWNYLINLRIKKAKELIVENKMNLSEISDYLNFNNLQYFSMQFKKIVGISPSQYISSINSAHTSETNDYFDPNEEET